MSEELKQALIEIDKLKNKVNKLDGKNENGCLLYTNIENLLNFDSF